MTQNQIPQITIDSNRMECLNIIGQAIFDKKGSNIVALDLSDYPGFFKYCIVAEGFVEQHLEAIGLEIKRSLKEKMREKCLRMQADSSWVVLDYGDIMIHLFDSHARSFYSIEKIWENAPRIELKIDMSTPFSEMSQFYSVPEL